MAQWADYGISEVHYEGTSIESVRAHEIDAKNNVAGYEKMTVTSVLGKLQDAKNPKTFVTITKDNKGNWKQGASVIPDGKEHIKTEPNAREGDNLSNLPTF